MAGAGVSAEATHWLIQQGIKLMGIDTWGWGQPFWAQKERFKATGDASIIWEAHRVGKEAEYCQIEPHKSPLLDAKRAIRLARHHAND